jgi:hypothetical protein
VPLVFGRCVLGTFDFEQFALDRTPRAEFQLDEREVCAHLQWGRAITFLIAQLQDARNTLDKRFAPFARFQSLCAQLIADAPVPNSQLMAIATDLFGEIIPVRKVRLERKRATDLFQKTEGRRIAQLRFRGGSDRRISWEWDESSDALLESQSESDPGKTVTTMMTSYSALLLALPRQDLGDDTFLVAIDRILRELSLHEANLSVATNDAGKLGLDVFYRLNELLRLYLPDPSAQAGLTPPTRYAWFLYVRQCASEDGHDAWSCNPDSTRLGETLASCHTREMEDIIDQTRRRTELSSKKRAEQSGTTRRDRIITALIEVLRARSRNAEDEEFKDVIKSITTALADPPSDDALKSAITAHLSRPKSDKDGIVAGKRALGFTRSVARACRPIVVPDINLSPNRSERDHGWFWTYPYTVIGIPFMLEGKCIAVLNVFRERQSSSDMGFFRIEERDKAQQLADKVQELFDKFLATEPLSVPSDEEWRTSLLPLCQALRDRTRAEENKLVVIQSPFARSRESFDELFTHVFSDRAPFSELRDPVRLFDEHRSYLRRNVVIRFDRKHWDTVTKLKELGRDLALIIDHAKRVFLFVSGDEDIGITKSVPFYADHIPFRWLDESLLRRDVTQEKELYGRWLLGSASASISTGNRILARRDGPWSHSAFRAWLFKCGRVAEREDFYAASRHLRRGSSWRPSEQILSLDNWDVQNEKEG